MRKIVFILVFILSYGSFLFGNGGVRVGANNIIVFQQGFVIESLSGYGFSNSTYSPIFNIGSGNPALISDLTKLSLGISCQYDSQIKSFFLNDVTFQRTNKFIPQSAGIVYSFQNLGFGVGFSQKYSGEINIGTGESFSAISKSIIYSYSPMVSYQFNKIFSPDDQLSVGIQVSINFLRSNESISDRLVARLDDDAVNFKAGLGYTYYHPAIDKLQLGIVYETKIIFSGYPNYFVPSAVVPIRFFDLIQVPLVLTCPAKTKFGFLFKPISKFGLYNDFIYNFWNDLYPTNNNKLDLSGGLILNASKAMTVSLGYYKYEVFSIGGLTGIENDENDSVLISGGFIFGYRQVNIHLVLADSHLFSGERSKQTIGKMGIVFNL